MENKFALKLLEIRQSNRNVNKNIKMSIRSKKKKKTIIITIYNSCN